MAHANTVPRPCFFTAFVISPSTRFNRLGRITSDHSPRAPLPLLFHASPTCLSKVFSYSSSPNLFLFCGGAEMGRIPGIKGKR